MTRRTLGVVAAAGLAVVATIVIANCDGRPDGPAERHAALEEVTLTTEAARSDVAPGDARLGALRISEVHYHPESDHPAEEFIELVNASTNTMSLAGWCVDGIDWCFDDGTVEPGGAVPIWTADTDGRLSNGGEVIQLAAPDGTIVDRVDYGDRGEWPATADGHGASLHRLDVAAPGHSGNWVAAAPTPGAAADVGGGVMPVWSDVEYTRSPAAGDEIAVTARLGGVERVRAEVAYRIGFDDEVFVPIDIDSDGTVRITIPGQDAGSLVRFRLVALGPDDVVGTWPRQGDGAEYVGTTVRSEVASPPDLPRVEWFMEPAAYEEAFNDLTLVGDTGYPSVFAIDGEVFDGALVRVKGGSSRGWPKPKWKITLPAGHRAMIDGITAAPVDEFALHGSWNDKSFIREVLSHDAMELAGLPVTHVAPIQVTLNSEFYGLYNYVEQSDGTWRDRVGLDDAIVYEVGAGAPGFFVAADAELPRDELRRRYQRESDAWVDDDDELRSLLADLERIQSLDADERRDWIFEHLDVPAFVNKIAVSSLIQHRDYWSKNFRVAYSPDEQRWTVVPFDLELTWGRSFAESCQSQCDDVVIEGEFGKPSSALFGPFSTDPVLSDMVRRRMLSLIDPLLEPTALRARTGVLESLLGESAALDRARWGTYGAAQSFPDAVRELENDFADAQYRFMLGSDSPAALHDLDLQAESIDVVVAGTGEEIVVTIDNTGPDAADVSGREVADFGELPKGLVIPAGSSVTVDADGRIGWS